MAYVSFPSVSRIAICGGTHGNELSGIYLLREMQKQKVDKVGSISVTTMISNPRAVDVCRRYTEMDLNRCFTEALLSSPVTDSTPHEVIRAQELNTQLGPKGSQEAVDVLCDLHNTTANMGLCFMFYSFDWLTVHIYKYLKNKITSVPVRAIQISATCCDSYSLDAVGKHGFTLELGPQPHGVIRADIFNVMKEAVDLMLEWIQNFNSGCTFEGGEVEVYANVKSVDYPRDPVTQEITAAIHPQLQDNDFSLLQPGDPIFLSFLGETVKYEGEMLHPFFVNEGAYYEKKIAFQLARKTVLTVPSISMKTD